MEAITQPKHLGSKRWRSICLASSSCPGRFLIILPVFDSFDSLKSSIITVIPVYNGEKFIRATLESVAAQTVKPDRLIVLDNCSTDGTAKIVQEFNRSEERRVGKE